MDLAASAGLILEPHQQLVLEGALGERPDGSWAAFEVGVVEPRQNGKGGIIQARELAGLYLFGDELQTHTAHRFDTCLEGFRRIRELVESSPWFTKRIKKITEAHGQESIELRNPTQRLNFKARAKGSGRGFSGDVVYLDEAFWLMELGAMLPTMSARPNPQLYYLSSHPLPRVESDILRRLCRRGRRAALGLAPGNRLAYFDWCAELGDIELTTREEWEAAVAAILDDHQAWAEANPGLGYRITEEFIQSERDAMEAEEFARERLGIYYDLDNVEAVIDPDDWRACRAVVVDGEVQRPASELLDSPSFAVEVSMDRRSAVIGAAGASSLGGTHVEIVEDRKRTGWVVKRLVELRDEHHPAAILINPAGPAGGLIPDCEKAGLKVRKGTDKGDIVLVVGRDYSHACQAAFDDITEHRWRHPDDPALNQAVAGAEKDEVGDAWVFARDGKTEVAHLAAVAMAAWHAGRPGEGEPNIW